MSSTPHVPWFRILLPGILVAATGVGAGDLLTASLAGSELGTVILWGAVVGAVMKWVLNEGIARWQMATGTSLLEGWVRRLGWIDWIFVPYLLLWSFFVGGALVSACGVAGVGLAPILGGDGDKILWGVIHSLAGLVLVWWGGFRVFERLMSICIGVLFVSVLLTALLCRPDWSEVFTGIVIPRLPSGNVAWLVALIGGVGGTVTLLSYGYWIREEGRTGWRGLRVSQIDLGVGYTMTALFGMSMVIIGSQAELDGSGSAVALVLADQLGQTVGSAGKWIFLVGFWGAVFSSLLGVWQGVPYLFADYCAIRAGLSAEERTRLDFKRSLPYRFYLLLIATLPLVALLFPLKQVQLTYAVLGAVFMPLVALTLLIMNNRRAWVGDRFRNGPIINTLLAVTLLFFGYFGAVEVLQKLSP